jgi:predicted aldo/keto reductase-like oxidoreductase
MNYRKFGTLDWQASALGFGCMRFPVVDGNASRIEEKEASRILLHAIDQGVNYIDTAYPYHGGTSESFLGRTLEGTYREKIKLATKMPTWKIKDAKDFDFYLNEQLERLRTDRIDFYLLHALNKKYWKTVYELDVLDWAEKTKADGRIGYLGFSFHDELDVFQSIVDAYQEWDLCLIHYNYMDRDHQAGRKGLKYAADRGMAVVIMEPLRGGRLVDPPQSVQEHWDQSDRDWAPAEWSLQWLWNQPEVSLVLSGMSTQDQVKENLTSASRSGIGVLSAEDIKRIDEVRKIYLEMALIPCTQCDYCVPCPEGIDIPRILRIYNDGIMYDKVDLAKREYNLFVPNDKKGSMCVICRECEEKCPQDIPISDWMSRIHEEYTQKTS